MHALQPRTPGRGSASESVHGGGRPYGRSRSFEASMHGGWRVVLGAGDGRARARAGAGGEGRLRKLEATANFFAGCHRLSLGSLAFVRLVAQLLLDLADVGG